MPPLFKGAERDAADLLARVGRGFAHHRHLKDRAAFFVFPAEGGQVGLACFVPRRLAEQRGEAATARLDEILTLFSQNSGIEGDGEQTVLVGELRVYAAFQVRPGKLHVLIGRDIAHIFERLRVRV